MTEKRVFKIEDEIDPVRIDRFLSERNPDLSRQFLQKLIEQGAVTVNHKIIKASRKIAAGDCIELQIPELKELDLVPLEMPLEVLFEDQDILVLVKAAGMVVHPADHGKYHQNSLVNGLLFHTDRELGGIGGVKRPGIVHRLDKDTSGLMVIAKNDLAQRGLMQQFKDRSVNKKYWALVCGSLKQKQGMIDLPIGRDLRNRKRMAINSINGRDARTEFVVNNQWSLGKGLGYVSLIDIKLLTGRTHQIRVHFKAINHPLVGDETYGFSKINAYFGKTFDLKRQFLHAYSLEFSHPRTNQKLSFKSELPIDLRSVVEQLKMSGN